MLIERTLIANSSEGMTSYIADIEMKNVSVVNFHIYLQNGTLMARERLTMKDSKLVMTDDEHLYIHGSRALFYGTNFNFHY